MVGVLAAIALTGMLASRGDFQPQTSGVTRQMTESFSVNYYFSGIIFDFRYRDEGSLSSSPGEAAGFFDLGRDSGKIPAK